MRLARVIGNLVSSVKIESHEGSKLLFVQPVDADGLPFDQAILAVDGAQAGVGDYVLLVQEGKSARQVMNHPTAPVEAIIVGVIDHLELRGRVSVLAPPSDLKQDRVPARAKQPKQAKQPKRNESK